MIIKRPPDFIIDEGEDPYLLRWFLIPRNPIFNIYLHKFLKSDNDVCHDHPWHSLSIALKGKAKEYWTEAPNHFGIRPINEGDWIFRKATHRHRMIIDKPFWTLFITGPRIREWGFWCDRSRFVHWKEFTAPGNKGEIGKGCGE